ncbi:Lipid phosphate phosphatase [Musa troglodytarum]|uniref:Lipid phosphate phosphatase n=1 Tax=Musa troglodytarum TaxID=320322 RepID=A0A9E7GY42_9LILI|nr:Lipid phosphate phosphatase [Musa troglodytarum]
MPVYYYPVRQPPSYNLAAVQPGLGDPNLISSGGKPAMPANSELLANLYRTAAPSPAATLQPQVIHVAADQARSYGAGMGYHVVPQQQQQHISHSPATTSNYGYEYFADHTRPQMYYSKATPVPLSSGVVNADATATADDKATRAT